MNAVATFSLASLVRGAPTIPPRILCYGSGGVGKTTLLAGMPAPVLLQTEDGLGTLDVPRFPMLQTFDDIRAATLSLYQEEHDRRSVLLDSLDWLEPIVWAEACKREELSSIDEKNCYGRGYLAADAVWKELFSFFGYLRTERNMSVGMIAHAEVRKYEAPDQPPYDRYHIKLHKRAAALVQEHVDATLFINFVTSTTEDKAKGVKAGEGRKRGVGGGQRRIYTEERPAFLAKNRWQMPDFIDLPDDPAGAWPAVAQHIPYFHTQGA